MIIDFETDPWTASMYDIFNSLTGENINNLHIFYADDDTGLIRRHLMTLEGDFIWAGDGSAAFATERRPIRIVRKPGVPSDLAP